MKNAYNTSAYGSFAYVYDIFMDKVEYEKWAEYLIGRLREYGIEDGIVLELGGGTGVMTELLAESGYDMIGVDNSEEMLGEAMEKRAESGYEILYLESSDDVLVKRYKETRRFHPLAGSDGRVEDGLKRERELLGFLKKKADYLVDTSHMLTRELKAELNKIFVQNKEYKNLYITVLSFGFKYGIPADCDLVFDVRFLPNPFYIDDLKPLTGNDKPVFDYVMNSDTAKTFLYKLKDMLDFLIPNYITEGKNQLVIAIGCTGGKHRSVTLTNAIYSEFENSNYGCKKEHRDIEKDRLRNLCRFPEK